MKILVTPTSMNPDKPSDALNTLMHFSQDLVFNTTGKPLTEESLIPLLNGCDGYLAGLDFVTQRVIDACPDLKVISRYGAGTDRVDLAAARRAGIPVTNTPGVNAEAVGELAFGLILSLARKIPYLNNQTRSGSWIRSTGMELKGKTIGILGLGAIGKVVARCSLGFDMRVLAYDPFIDAAFCKEHGIDNCNLKELLAAADIISLHLPLTDATKNYINGDIIAGMKDGALLVNTSRGGIIDEDAAFTALKTNKLGGLGLDAFAVEPPVGSPLFTLDNVIVTPHTGAHTRESTQSMANAAVRNLIDILSGKHCPFIVN